VRRRSLIATIGLIAVWSSLAAADALRGSKASIGLQVRIALENDFTLLDTSSEVRRFVALGRLVRVTENSDLRLSGVAFPVARPEVRTFVRRLASQYRRACGEKLVVTSLTRPKSRQPTNAHRRSVHRTGMGVDLRRSRNARCRSWLERVLRSLEKRGVIEATREHRPSHYHVAVFPKRYRHYVVQLEGNAGSGRVVAARGDSQRYSVRDGDTLWEIARRHGTTVLRLRRANRLSGKTIVAGQSLWIPSGS
jgi:hypothetical protein